MFIRTKPPLLPTLRALLIVSLLSACAAWASVGGSISGTIKDPAGRVVPNASVTVREISTALAYQTHSDNKGFYIFPVLPVGHYELQVQAPGFSGYQRTDIVLDTNAALTLDAALEVGGVAQTVSVIDNSLHVETTSTQLGQVITGRQMTAVPLDGRSYTDLLSLQPGRRPADNDYFYHGAGCGRHRAQPFGDAQSRHHLGQWAARVCQLLQRERC